MKKLMLITVLSLLLAGIVYGANLYPALPFWLSGTTSSGFDPGDTLLLETGGSDTLLLETGGADTLLLE